MSSQTVKDLVFSFFLLSTWLALLYSIHRYSMNPVPVICKKILLSKHYPKYIN